MKRHLFLTVTLIMFFSLAVNAFAATYYVKPNGNNALNGRSDATAWKTIDKVNRYSFATGDDVYFKCGGVWTNARLLIDWSGNANNRVVVGAYYGSGTIGVSGNKPVFDGTYSFPGDKNNGRDYITIENLKLINSKGHLFTAVNGSNINVSNLELDKAYNAGIKYYNIDTGLVNACIVTDTGRKRIESPGTDWPASIGLVNGTNNITISNNTVYDNRGEGIGMYKNVDDCIIEKNVLYENDRVSIYIGQAAGNVVRYNLVYGSADATADGGIGVNDEKQFSYAYCKNNKIYNNLVANCHRGIYLDTGHPDSILKDTVVYNNTVVDCWVNFSTQDNAQNSFVKNNISWCTSSDCRHAYVANTKGGITWDHNLWSSAPDVDAIGVNDPPYADPKLRKTAGWHSVKGGELTAADFALQSGSPAIDTGTALGAEFKNIPECDKSVWPAQIVFTDQNNQGSGWEIGADIYVANPTALDPPTNLTIVESVQ